MKNTIFAFYLSLILIGSAASAFDMPPIPDKFFGTVIADGKNVTNGTLITVKVEGVLDSIYNMTEDGYYELYVRKGVLGNKIEFLINGNLYGMAKRVGGATIEYNLTYTTPVTPSVVPPITTAGGGGGGAPSSYCGDKKCNAPGETSANCPADCTSPINVTNTTANTTVAPKCDEWSCTEWGGCDVVTLTQTRQCLLDSACNVTLIKPPESQRCIPAAIKVVLDELVNASNTKSIASQNLIERAVRAYGEGKYDIAAELARSAVEIDASAAASEKAKALSPTGFSISGTAKNAGLAILVLAAAIFLASKLWKK